MSQKGIVQIRLGNIVVDTSYQVRMKIEKDRVVAYHNVLKTRENNPFPPIIIEKDTNKLVCGFTRMEAYKRFYKPDDTVPAIFETFSNEKDRLFFSIEDNNHGQPLQSWDKKNLISKLISSKASLDEISELFGWPMKRLEDLGGGIFISKRKSNAKKSESESNGDEKGEDKKAKKDPFIYVSGKLYPLKSGLEHLNGKETTPKIYKRIVENYSGWNEQMHSNQLIMRLEDGTINFENENTVESLRILFEKLKEVFK